MNVPVNTCLMKNENCIFLHIYRKTVRQSLMADDMPNSINFSSNAMQCTKTKPCKPGVESLISGFSNLPGDSLFFKKSPFSV